MGHECEVGDEFVGCLHRLEIFGKASARPPITFSSPSLRARGRLDSFSERPRTVNFTGHLDLHKLFRSSNLGPTTGRRV